MNDAQLVQAMLESASEAETRAIGAAVGERLRAGDVVLLEGGLGAGKSTLARGLLAALGFTGEVASPTFPIMLVYEPPEARLAVVHCDFYRLDDPAEAEELGLDDWLIDGALIAEWPGRGPGWLRRDPLAIHIEMGEGALRRLTVTGGAAWKERWPFDPT